MRADRISTRRMSVDGQARVIAPYGQMSLNLIGEKEAVWRGMPLPWTGDYRVYNTGVLAVSTYDDGQSYLSQSRSLLHPITESMETGEDIRGVEDPTFVQCMAFGGSLLFYTQVLVKRNPQPESWAFTCLAYREYQGGILGPPTVFLRPSDVEAALEVECDMVKEAEPSCIDEGVILFEYGARRSQPYTDRDGEEQWFSSSIGYCNPDGQIIRSLLTAEQAGVEHLSTAGPPFRTPNHRLYLVYNRRVGGCWSVWLGRLKGSVEDDNLSLTPVQELIPPPDPAVMGMGPDSQLVAFASCVRYDSAKSRLDIFYHVNDVSLFKDVFSLAA